MIRKIFYPFRVIITCSLLPFFASISSAHAQQPSELNMQGQQPVMNFSSLQHSFKNIYRGEKVSFAFEFTNSGNGTLEVRSIHAACGCVNTQVLPKNQFAPGESGKISFEFDSTNFSGDISRVITVDTNETTHSTTILSFSANIIEEIKTTPSLIYFGEIEKGAPVNSEFIVNMLAKAPPNLNSKNLEFKNAPEKVKAIFANKDYKEFEILDVTTSSPNISAKLVKVGNQSKVQIKLGESSPIGSFRERVTIWNTSTWLKELVVPVVGEVVGHVKLSSKYLEFGVLKNNSIVKRSIEIESSSNDFQITKIDIDLRPVEGLKAIPITDIIEQQIEKKGKGFVVNFNLRFPKAFPANISITNVSGNFLVKTNDPDYKEIRIPFFGVIKQD